MALICDGDGWVEVPFAASLETPTDEITVALWFIRDQVASDDNNYVLVRKDSLTYRLQKSGIGNSADQELSFRTTDDGLQGQVIDDVVDNSPAWRFIVIRWADNQAVQVDSYDTGGTLQVTESTGVLTGVIDYQGADGDIVIGGDGSNNTQGMVAGVYIHDTRLTNTQVTDLLDDTVSLTTDSGFTAPAITPSAGFWPLDFDARDASGNGNDGTAEGTADFTEEAGAPEVTAAIGLTLDVTAESTATHQVTATVPLTLDIAAETTATHQVAASVPLTLDVAATTQAPGAGPDYLSVAVGPMREPIQVATMRDPLLAGAISGVEPVAVGALADSTPTVGVLRDESPTIGVLREPLQVDTMRDPVLVDELRE